MKEVNLLFTNQVLFCASVTAIE